MKQVLMLTCLLAGMAVFTQSCTKAHKECTVYTQLRGQAHEIDMALLNAEAPEIKQAIDSTPALQAYELTNDQYACVVHCHIFYGGLPIFTNNMVYSKSKSDGSIYSYGDEIPDTIAVSAVPAISGLLAVAKAHKLADFGISCTDYRLGYYDVTVASYTGPANYKLVWDIRASDHGSPHVVIDAHTGETIMTDNGIIVD